MSCSNDVYLIGIFLFIEIDFINTFIDEINQSTFTKWVECSYSTFS
jgi:hypothetical protein